MPKRVDANQREIVATMRNLGASVRILSDVGKGCPDLLVGFGGCNYLFEVKDGSKPKSARKLTPQEQTFFDAWKGQVAVINSLDEVVLFFRDLILRK
jgi:hypothetical protein